MTKLDTPFGMLQGRRKKRTGVTARTLLEKSDEMSAPDTLTTTQVAKALGVSVATLHNWKKTGKLVPTGECKRGYNAYTSLQLSEFQVAQAGLLGFEKPSAAVVGAATAAKLLGIAVTRLRSLDRAGRFVPAGRSASNRRMYTKLQVESLREYLEAGGMPPRIAKLTVTRHEAAQFLGVGVRTLQRWEQEKKLVPLARWDSHSLYTKGQIRVFLETEM